MCRTSPSSEIRLATATRNGIVTEQGPIYVSDPAGNYVEILTLK